MKKLITIIFLFAFIFTMSAQIKKDKYYHAGAGVVISGSSFLITNHYTKDPATAFRLSAGLVTCSAFGKELFDSFGSGQFSWSDFAFTEISGLVTSSALYFIYKKKKKAKFNKDLIID